MPSYITSSAKAIVVLVLRCSRPSPTYRTSTRTVFGLGRVVWCHQGSPCRARTLAHSRKQQYGLSSQRTSQRSSQRTSSRTAYASELRCVRTGTSEFRPARIRNVSGFPTG
eukprot:scaffold640676_cov18-Prasinocladus_malaysianus.AAC.1